MNSQMLLGHGDIERTVVASLLWHGFLVFEAEKKQSENIQEL